MLERAFEAGVPATWVTGVGAYGKDESLRRRLRGSRRPHVLLVERSEGPKVEVDSVPVWRWMEPLAPEAFAWERMAASTGSEGPSAYEWARGRLDHRTTAGWAHWLLVRRPATLPKREHVYYRAYGPEETPLTELARVASISRLIAEDLERLKGRVRMDQYEVRGWEAWHRHVTLCLLAHAALEVIRASEKGGEVDQRLTHIDDDKESP